MRRFVTLLCSVLILSSRSFFEERQEEAPTDIPEEVIDISDSMNTVLKKFEASGAWNLPVVEDSKYVGFVSRSKLFDTYRQQLVDITE